MLVIMSEKKKKRAPTTIAPITLVAGNAIASRITANRIVPRIPIRTAESGMQQPLHSAIPRESDAANSVTARYTTAITIAASKSIGVKEITAVICKKAARIPMITLAIIAMLVQSRFFPQLTIDIEFTSFTNNVCRKVFGGALGGKRI